MASSAPRRALRIIGPAVALLVVLQIVSELRSVSMASPGVSTGVDPSARAAAPHAARAVEPHKNHSNVSTVPTQEKREKKEGEGSAVEAEVEEAVEEEAAVEEPRRYAGWNIKKRALRHARVVAEEGDESPNSAEGERSGVERSVGGRGKKQRRKRRRKLRMSTDDTALADNEDGGAERASLVLEERRPAAMAKGRCAGGIITVHDPAEEAVRAAGVESVEQLADVLATVRRARAPRKTQRMRIGKVMKSADGACVECAPSIVPEALVRAHTRWEQLGDTHLQGVLEDNIRLDILQRAERMHADVFAQEAQPHIAIVTTFDEGSKEQYPVEWLRKAKSCYAGNLGYTLAMGASARVRAPDQRWAKIANLVRLLPHTDWLFWSDLDAFPVHDRIPLETFIREAGEGAGLILQALPPARRLNDSHFLLRNTPLMREFLRQWFTHFDKCTCDQRGLNIMLLRWVSFVRGIPYDARCETACAHKHHELVAKCVGGEFTQRLNFTNTTQVAPLYMHDPLRQRPDRLMMFSTDWGRYDIDYKPGDAFLHSKPTRETGVWQMLRNAVSRSFAHEGECTFPTDEVLAAIGRLPGGKVHPDDVPK